MRMEAQGASFYTDYQVFFIKHLFYGKDDESAF